MPFHSTGRGNAQSIVVPHQYVVEIQRKGERLSTPIVRPDWIPAVEWWHWRRIQKGIEPATMPPPPAVVRPVWDPQLGAPYVAGMRIAAQSGLGAEGGECPQLEDIPAAFFYPFIHRNSEFTLNELERLGGSGKLKILAYALEHHRQAPASRFCIEEISHELPLQETAMEFFSEQGRESGANASNVANDDDFPVYVGTTVIQEMMAQSVAAGESETGGVLIGSLHRDPWSSKIVAEVTAQIPALHVQSGRYSLAFTPATWTAVHDALSLRKSNEIALGWHHFHPDFCANCPPERRGTCPFSVPFFSQDDRALHREVFPRAFNVAVLITNRGPAGFAVNMFGWRYGMIMERSFSTISHTTV